MIGDAIALGRHPKSARAVRVAEGWRIYRPGRRAAIVLTLAEVDALADASKDAR